MFYIVPIIIYKTIENSSASKEKFITLIQILVKKKLFHGSARSLHRGTQREYSSKPLQHSIVKRIVVFKR